MNQPQYHQWNEVLGLATKQAGKPSVYISNGLEFLTAKDEEIWRFVQFELRKLYGVSEDTCPSKYPYKYMNTCSDVLTGGLFFFENEEDQYRFYRIFEQPLTDSSPIYACTYNKNGDAETENT